MDIFLVHSVPSDFAKLRNRISHITWHSPVTVTICSRKFSIGVKTVVTHSVSSCTFVSRKPNSVTICFAGKVEFSEKYI